MHNKAPYLLLVLMLMATLGTFEFLHLRNSVPSASAVEATANIGVYWDQSCSNMVSSIDWGVLSPGQTRQVAVYVRNEGNQSILLAVTSANYSPANASNYLNFAWTCENTTIAPSKTVQVVQSLYVSPYAKGNSAFSFDIIFGGNLGDINGDGVVNILDVILLADAFNSKPGSGNWNPNADLNGDDVVNILDAIIIADLMSPA